METRQFVETGVYVFEKSRALGLTAQYMGADWLLGLFPGTKRIERKRDLAALKTLELELDALLRRDAKLFADGHLPLSLLVAGYSRAQLTQWWKTYPRLLVDGLRIYKRRGEKRGQDLSAKASQFSVDYPEYYRRNFHFQTDGYLSEDSAALYDHQVDLLFAGTSNAMRRLLVEPILAHRAGVTRGRQILELGCGTGSATEIVASLEPDSEIKTIDLSPHYLKLARQRLAKFLNVHPLRADAAALPFRGEQFDLVYSSFLFHELPREVREQVVREASRVLKPGGALVIVDSVQKGDSVAFDPLLDDFPKNFHEPFYKNYVQHPLRELLATCGFEMREESVGFASKCVYGVKKLN